MPNLLIAEDQINLREIMKTVFEDTFKVKLAANGFEALEILKTWHPDLIITDFDMPGMTGLELIRKIYKTEIKIILCSASLTDEIRREALALGVEACLEKPFDLEEIRELVARFG